MLHIVLIINFFLTLVVFNKNIYFSVLRTYIATLIPKIQWQYLQQNLIVFYY